MSLDTIVSSGPGRDPLKWVVVTVAGFSQPCLGHQISGTEVPATISVQRPMPQEQADINFPVRDRWSSVDHFHYVEPSGSAAGFSTRFPSGTWRQAGSVRDLTPQPTGAEVRVWTGGKVQRISIPSIEASKRAQHLVRRYRGFGYVNRLKRIWQKVIPRKAGC